MKIFALIFTLSLCAFAQDHKVGVNTYLIPKYPPIAKAARVQGTVVLNLRISSDATINETNVVSGHPMLRQAALEAVKGWRFICLDCKPGETFSHQLSFKFLLLDDPCFYDGQHHSTERLQPTWTATLAFPSVITVTAAPPCVETNYSVASN